MCIPEEMGVKDVDLREKCLSEEVPDHRPSLSSDALSPENGWRVITVKELSQELMNWIDHFQISVANSADVDLPEESVHSFDHYEESSGNLNTGIKPASPHNPSQVSGLNELKVVSVENNNESSFKFYGGRRDIKDVPLTAQSVLESKPVRQEEKNQPKEIIKATSSDVRRGWIVGFCLFCAFCVVGGAGDTHLETVFPNDIELCGRVPQASPSTWLHGITTVQRNEVNESNISGQNLRINNSQRIENYDLEIRLPGGIRSLQQFPMRAFYSCVVAKNEDLVAFKKGKKVGEVELHGKANVTKHYLFMMQNQTLQIYFKQGTDHRLQLDDVQCKVTFKDIGKSPDEAAATVENGGKEKSSDIGKYVATVFGAGVAVAIGLVFCRYLIKKRRQSKTAGTPDLEAAALASEEKLTRETRISCI